MYIIVVYYTNNAIFIHRLINLQKKQKQLDILRLLLIQFKKYVSCIINYYKIA